MDVQKEYGGAKHNLAASLQNESAEHRAKVLEFVLDWNINPNEEFFLIFCSDRSPKGTHRTSARRY